MIELLGCRKCRGTWTSAACKKGELKKCNVSHSLMRPMCLNFVCVCVCVCVDPVFEVHLVYEHSKARPAETRSDSGRGFSGLGWWTFSGLRS